MDIARVLLCAVLLLIAPLGAKAAANNQSGQCFEVAIAQSSGTPTILLNRCTGETWQLVKVATNPNNTGLFGPFVWRWFPIGVGQGEATLNVGQQNPN